MAGLSKELVLVGFSKELVLVGFLVRSWHGVGVFQ